MKQIFLLVFVLLLQVAKAEWNFTTSPPPSRPLDAQGLREFCGNGTFLTINWNGDHYCVRCSRCNWNTYMIASCDSLHDTVCGTCRGIWDPENSKIQAVREQCPWRTTPRYEPPTTPSYPDRLPVRYRWTPSYYYNQLTTPSPWRNYQDRYPPYYNYYYGQRNWEDWDYRQRLARNVRIMLGAGALIAVLGAIGLYTAVAKCVKHRRQKAAIIGDTVKILNEQIEKEQTVPGVHVV
ncbi:unnamed protein product, partial [Mesorhabditis spiculigera]